MEKLLPFFGLCIAVVAIGCSSSYQISSSVSSDSDNSISEFNSAAEGREGSITFEGHGESFEAAGIRATSDSLFWYDESGRRRSMATDGIKEVVFTNRARGIWEGVGLGFLVGAAAGFVYALQWVPNQHSNAGLEGLGYIVFPVLGGTAGTVVGGIYGGINGHPCTYTFH